MTVDPLRAVARRLATTGLGKLLVPLDRALQQRTAGRVGLLRLIGMRSLLLTTTGRKTGQPRTVPLLYVADGSDFVVAGSNWGGGSHPGWSANLLAHPHAQVCVDGRRIPVRAELATGQQRKRLWQLLVREWPTYRDYQRSAGERQIRVFRLVPQSR